MNITTLIGLAVIAVTFAGWMIARAQRRQRRMSLFRRTVDPARGHEATEHGDPP